MEDEEISMPRPLTPEELALLSWVLEHGLPEARTFALQVEKIRATKGCKCGCPSISLHVEEGTPLGECSHSPISDVRAKNPDGKEVGVILFQDSGKLSMLEVYSFDDIEGDWGFPVYESLQTWESFGISDMKGKKE